MKKLSLAARFIFKSISSLFEGKYKYLFISYLLVLFGLFLYSFTQVDLSLVFSRSAFLREIIKSFQYIGYFNRPLSADIYVSLLLLLFVYYIIFLRLAKKRKITRNQVWGLLFVMIPLFVVAYNGFSYDLFNYIFDAKIITFYHQNPYLHKALDYPHDPMLSFMHWTHRTYPYGPIWLVFTVPLSFIGLQFFIPTYYLFKFLMALSFLGCVYYIGKIASANGSKNEAFSMIFFALNPLIFIEALISAHNDIVMMFLSVFALYVLLQRKYIRSIIYLLLSIGIKFATFLVSPVFLLLGILLLKKRAYSFTGIIVSLIVIMLFGVVLATIRTTFQPWYLLYALPFAALIPEKFYIQIPGVVLPLSALATYLPFLFTGNWNPPIPTILSEIEIGGIIVSVAATVIYAGIIYLDRSIELRPSLRKYLFLPSNKR